MPARCMLASQKARHHAPDSHDKILKLPPFVLSKNLTLMVVMGIMYKIAFSCIIG